VPVSSNEVAAADAANLQPGIYADPQSLIELRLKAGLLKLDLSRVARSILAGQNSSRFRGRGMEYSESRHYQSGDDVRNFDWRVTARTGIPHTKVFIEERERPVYIVVDFSPTLFFGTRKTYKSVLAAQAASLLAWTAVHSGDRLGGVLRAHGRITDLKPKSGRKGALALVSALSSATLPGETIYQDKLTLNHALQHLSMVVHPGSLVFLFSDFYDIDKNTERLLSSIHQHNDVAIWNLVDPVEINPPPAGRYAITENSMTGRVTTIDTANQSTRRYYRSIFQERTGKLQNLSRSTGIPVIDLVNGDDLVTVMSRSFGKRKKHKAGVS
jgi:uncharacterized protein (DUF58 family)